MQKDTPAQIQPLRQFPPPNQERRITREAPLRPDLAPIRAASSHVRLSLRLLEGALDVGKACAAFLAGQYRSFFEVFLKACQVRTMRRRHIFQVEQMHLVRSEERRVGKECRTRW